MVYNAKIEKLGKNKVYRVVYWLQSEEYDDATDYGNANVPANN